MKQINIKLTERRFAEIKKCKAIQDKARGGVKPLTWEEFIWMIAQYKKTRRKSIFKF